MRGPVSSMPFVALALLLACGGGPAPAGTAPTAGAVEPSPVAPTTPEQEQPSAGSTGSPTTEPSGVDPGAGSSGSGEGPTAGDAKPSASALVAAGDPARGARLYEEMSCRGCHGTRAKPSSKFPRLFGLELGDRELERAFRVIKQGESPMPGFGGKLDDRQIADILRFLQDG